MAEFERVLCVKPEVFVYQIPARTTNRGYRAADWKLDEPSWTGKLRLIAKGDDLYMKLEDKHNGELFAQGLVDGYPGLAIESVLDSSRYFVFRIQDGTGRHAFVGIGFADRSDSFDLILNIQDHFKFLKRNEKDKEDTAAAIIAPGPKLDLGFKEGQTITINLGERREGAVKKRPQRNTSGAPGLLPPPPGGVKLPAPPKSNSNNPVPTIPLAANNVNKSASQSSASSGLDELLNFDVGSSAAPPVAQKTQVSNSGDPWGDFASAKPTQPKEDASGPWVQF